jgi:hypothetical protein
MYLIQSLAILCMLFVHILRNYVTTSEVMARLMCTYCFIPIGVGTVHDSCGSVINWPPGTAFFIKSSLFFEIQCI